MVLIRSVCQIVFTLAAFTAVMQQELAASIFCLGVAVLISLENIRDAITGS